MKARLDRLKEKESRRRRRDALSVPIPEPEFDDELRYIDPETNTSLVLRVAYEGAYGRLLA